MDIPWATVNSVSVHDGLTGSRAAVVDDTGPTIPEVAIEVLFDRVLPRPKIINNIDKILARLEKGPGRWGAYNSRTRRWRAFKDDPATAGKHENVVFGNLVSVANSISTVAEAFSDGEAALTRFGQDPNRAPKSEWRSSESQPDGYFILRDPRSGKTAHWMDIVATGEYKRDEKDVRNLEDDSKKVLWNMHQTLRDDPCRRFTFGFTIENRTMRIWYAGRAEILVSAPFDFMNEPRHLIHFFLVMFYSKDYELGWDPTMEYFPAAGKAKAYYIITVIGKEEETGEVKEVRYRTVKLLSSIGAEGLRGRGTRVWKVRRWEDGQAVGAPVVLKDCWIDSDRMREGDVAKMIKDDANKVGDVALDSSGATPGQVLDRSLLKVILDGDVDGDKFDHTMSEEDRLSVLDPNRWFVFHRTQEKLDKFHKLCAKAKGPRGMHRTIYDRLKSKHYTSLRPITYHPKSHYRIVFAEVCTVLHSIKSLPGVLDVLMELCLVLRALHVAGWVHRDISSGNVMVTSDNVVKLADVEYAKKIENSGAKCHDIRTGTVDFMAVEVDAMEYKFRLDVPPATVQLPPDDSEFSVQIADVWNGGAVHDPADYGESDEDEGTEDARQGHEDGRKIPQWAYNPIHDLESVFWLFLFFIIWHDILVLPLKAPGEMTGENGARAGEASDPDPDSDSSSASGSENSADLLRNARLPKLYRESASARRDRIKAWYGFGENLFIGRESRLGVMNVPGRLEDFISKHPLHPAVRDLGAHLVTCRGILVAAYRSLEEDQGMLGDSGRRLRAADGLHQKLRAVLLQAKKSIRWVGGWAVHIRKLAKEEWRLEREIKAQDDLARGEGTGVALPTAPNKETEPAEGRQGAEDPATLSDAGLDIVPPRQGRKKTATSKAPPAPPKRPTRVPATAKRKRGDDEPEAEAAVRAPRKAARKRKNESSVHDTGTKGVPVRRPTKDILLSHPTRTLRSRTKGAQSTILPEVSTAADRSKKRGLRADTKPLRPAGRTVRSRARK